ncbi:vitelline membrane outer layer protein 1 homolog isoform X4 [Penaeus chinensis]|uniref:vitelline membrane outer layer protein 1 homolog isoform X4 n=1 Tax=Penaeus chinensis TaxID=139456 RepID=UPI001FB5B40B|nr:vitelline membrane outer layer protein 1 homolog isoform X4 [Penaeus chinensis]
MPEIAGPGQDQYEARGGRTCIFSLAAAMLSLVAVLSLASLARAAPEPLEVSESLSLDNGLNRGDWGPIELCQTRSFAYGFQIKYQDLGFVDDTAANGLKLYCRDGLGATTGYITSLVGNHGTWRNILQCPSSAYVEGVRAYVLPDQGSMHDDLGVDNVQLWCSEGTILDGKNWLTARAAAAPADELLARAENLEIERERITVDEREVEAVYLKSGYKGTPRIDGVWSLWAYCSSGNYVCGLETRVEKESTFTDDAGLSDFVLYCCLL